VVWLIEVNAKMLWVRVWKQLMASLLIVVGVFIILRGVHYAIIYSLGWRAIFVSLFVGMLVIVLGIVRLHYWRKE